METRNIPIIKIPFSNEDKEFIKNGIFEVLESGMLTLGEKTKQFEKEFAEFTGTKYAVAVNSCSAAMEIALRAKDVEGKKVVIPSNTFISTATSVLHAGGNIVFCDCDVQNLCIDPSDLKKKVKQFSPDGMILVHIGGIISPHLEEIMEICEENNMFLLEDSAHGHGSTFKGRKAGSLGFAGAFSFYPTKVLTTGEGGVLTTNDKDVYDIALSLRDYGREKPDSYVHLRIGSNWKMSEIHAVIGLQQMGKVEKILRERREAAKIYDEKLKNIKGISPVKLPEFVQSSYYKYIAFLTEKDRVYVKSEMKKKGVSLTGEVYSEPLHLQKPLQIKRVLNCNDNFPNTEYVAEKHICLPDFPGLTKEDIEYIVETLKSVLQ